MQESNKITTNFGETLLEMMRQAVREEIQVLIQDLHEKIDYSQLRKPPRRSPYRPDWIYHNARKLRFTCQLGRKMLRFSRLGIQKWIGVRKIL